MNTQEQMKEVIRRIRELADRLEYVLKSPDSDSEMVQEFIHDIAWSVPNFKLDLLVKQLVREQKRAIVSQEIDTVGPGATVIGAKIDRIG